VSWSRTLKLRQLLRAQLEAGEPIALLFSDIRGFSTYAAERGDRAAFQLAQLHEGILKDRIAEYGIVVKSLGDGVMAAFETATLGVQAAVAVQDAFRERNASHPTAPMDLGIGIAAGTPVMTDIDFIGHSVNLSQRLSALAKSGQILVPSALATHTPLPRGLTYTSVGDRVLRGLGSYSLSEVIWLGEVARISDGRDRVTLLLTETGTLVFALAKDAKQELREALGQMTGARAEDEGAFRAWLQRGVARLAKRLIGEPMQAMGMPREMPVRDVKLIRRGRTLRVQFAGRRVDLTGVDVGAADRFVERAGRWGESDSDEARG
jgi:class 3 adenylate cyclase